MVTAKEVANDRRRYRNAWKFTRTDPSRDEWMRERDNRIDHHVEKSTRASRAGKLLDAILSSPPREALIDLLAEYQFSGYTRGLKAIVKIVESENARLWQCAKPEEAKTPLYWDQDFQILVSLFFTIGAMDTTDSHETLLHFMNESYHPVVRGEAVEGMSKEQTRFDKQLVLNILHGDLPIVMRWQAIYSAECHSYEFTAKEYVSAIEPYLCHEDHNVRVLTIDALTHKWAGREILRSYLEMLRTGHVPPSEWPHAISTIEQCLASFEEEDARREAKRRRATNEP